MTIYKFTDKAELSGVSFTKEGFLVGVVKCARTGLQDYLASEVGLTGDAIVQVNRSEKEVFSEDSRKTFSHAPITMGHPGELVTKDNWKDFAVGEVSTDVKFEAGWVHVPIIVKAAAAIDAIKDGIREISMGYECQLVANDGQLEQTDIKINHLAFVKNGRAGSDARIGDDAFNWGASPIIKEDHMTDLITVVVGDKAVKMSVLDAATFEAFRASMQADHKSVIEMKDTEIGELKAKLADAEKAVLSDDDLDKMLQKRSALVDLAKKIKTDLVADGKTDDEIRSEAVAKQFGDEAIKDASAAEIAGMFKIATSKADVNDKARTALGDVKQVTADSWDKFVKKGDK